MSALPSIDGLESQAEALLAAIRALRTPEATSEPIIITAPRVAPTPANDRTFASNFTDLGKFYDYLRSNSMLGPKISATEFSGCQAILAACISSLWPISYTAYALATAYHETAHTMQPVKEIGGDAYYTRMYDIKGQRPAKAIELGNLTPGDGARYCGRGYVQLTGKKNYALAAAKLALDLINHPELALTLDVAAQILIHGMAEGWFTGRSLPTDLPSADLATLSQFTSARDIINGRDRAQMIAGYAIDWQSALQAGGYKLAA